MNTLLKSAFAFAAILTTVVGTSAFVSTAQAATVVPPPPPRGDASNAPGGVLVEDSVEVIDRTGCFEHGEALKRLTREWKHAGYLATYQPRYYDNNTKVQLFGVKAGDEWYAFTFDMCRARILEEGKLKNGKPGFL
jgi:hypothetical protein